MLYREVNFDGLVGPNHNYAGLAEGNLASLQNRRQTSYPKKAALQGIAKMKLLTHLGVQQAILPPHQRPQISSLRKLGFNGKAKRVITKCAQQAPHLLAAIYSSSAMWTANCATVSPSSDTLDTKLHLTPANLTNNFHRSLEADFSYKILKTIFNSKKYFKVHSPLPSCQNLADEGAANHMRLFSPNTNQGLEVFVYGKSDHTSRTKVYSARQDLMASQAIILRHNLKENHSLTIEQNPQAIDMGVFHNDVICTSHENFLLTHENAFSNQEKTLNSIKDRFQLLTGNNLIVKQISEKDLPVKDAIKCYLFNSQIVTSKNKSMTLIAPQECQESDKARKLINLMVQSSDTPLNEVKYIDLKQSMSNGGGPACLRLRVMMNDNEIEAINQNFIFTDSLCKKLEAWIHKHYRDELNPQDLADPLLYEENLTALDELSQILNTPKLYPFQN